MVCERVDFRIFRFLGNPICCSYRIVVNKCFAFAQCVGTLVEFAKFG